MPDLWMPGATRYPNSDTGTMDGGPPRAVWHITSNSNDWTFKNELGYFTGGGRGVAPHLLWDPFTGQIAQFFPADSRALALRNAGSVRTNRTGRYCIQIETVFTAGETVNGRRYATVRDTPCKNLSLIVAWLRSLGIPDRWPGGAPTGFARDTVSLDTWTTQAGHYGHNQTPGNDHVDPGPMPNLFAAGTYTEEDDVSLTTTQATQLAELHRALVPYMGWQYKGKGETRDTYSYLRDTSADVRALAAKLDAQGKTISQLVQTVATLAAGLGDLDPAAIVTELKASIEAIDIRLDVPDAQ
ncbi:hypothetical protein [Streptomyces sp. bgisy154]|uniref:hypothetical protein n=1 Tax=Streptomyces sp. bgisy154 TaxID=3413794 RepID=UPI003D72C902